MSKLRGFERVTRVLVALLTVIALAFPFATVAEAATKTSNVTIYVNSATQSTKTLKASGLTASKAKWSTTNKAIATINSKGVVTAKKVGKATVTAKQGNNTWKFVVTVKKVTLSKTSATLYEGKTLTLKLTGDTIKSVKSSNTKVATIATTGKVTAKKAGTATITVVSKKGTKFTCKLTVKKVTLSKTSATLYVGKTLTLKLTGDTIKSTSSSNTGVATVTKAGKVTAKKAGTATITVVSSLGKKFTCKVTVKVAVTGVSFKNKTLTIDTSDGVVANPATVAPSNASDKTVTYKSSNTKVAKVDSKGNITPVSEGAATITATASGKTATCKVTVTTKNITVSTGEALNAAVSSDKAYESITYKTDAAETVVIDGYDCSDTTLIIDAPNATIENYATFKVVELRAISADTYIEHAGNTINCSAQDAHIVVADDANGSVDICLLPEADNVAIENNGFIDNITIQTDNHVTISGASGQVGIDTQLEASPTIKTSMVLNIKGTADVAAASTLVLDEGSQGTTATVLVSDDTQAAASAPTVCGIGTLQVNAVNSDNDVIDQQTVVAQQTDEVTTTKTSVSGVVRNYQDQTTIAGATVAAYPWTADASAGNVDGLTPVATSSTADDGTYTLTDVSTGNYVLYATAAEYVPATKILLLDSNSGSNVVGQNLSMLPDTSQGDEPGSISGMVIDGSQQGDIGIEGITVRLRSGDNNVTGSVLQAVTTDEGGAYTFSEVDAGVYTLEAVDLRSGVDRRYVTSRETVSVTSGAETTGTLSMVPVVETGQLVFRLTWSDYEEGKDIPSDLDSHLYGPRVSGGMFHTYYSDTEYYDGSRTIAWLDRDDTDYHGPETTTVEQQSNGVYTFFVHDYTNRYSDDSSAMSTSGAFVEVIAGSTILATYYVPSEPGTVWAVCSYNPATKVITPINTMGFEENPTSVGKDVLYKGLKVTGVKLNDYVTSGSIDGDIITITVTAPLTQDKLSMIEFETEGGVAEAVYDDATGSYLVVATGEDGTIRTYDLYCSVDYGDLYIESIQTNDMVTEARIGDDYVDLKVVDADFSAYKDYVVPVIAKDGATYTIYQDENGHAFLAITDGNITRRYLISVSVDWGDLKITGLETNQMVTDYHIYSNVIELITVNVNYEAYKDYVVPAIAKEGATYTIGQDEYGDAYIDITDGDRTHRYWISPYQDWGDLELVGFERSGHVVSWEIHHDYVYLGLDEDGLTIDDWIDDVKPIVKMADATASVFEDDGYVRIKLTDPDGSLSRMYSVSVSFDEWQGLELTGVETNDIITDRTNFAEDDIYVYATTSDIDTVMANFVPTIGRDDATYELAKVVDPGEDGAFTLTMRAGNLERTYRAWTYVDWQGLELTDVECNDVVTDLSDWDFDNIYITTTTGDIDTVMESFKPIIGRDDATYTLAKTESGEARDFTLTMSANGMTRSYRCWITVDWRGLEVADIEANDVVTELVNIEESDIYIYAATDDIDMVMEYLRPTIGRDDATYEVTKISPEDDVAFTLTLSANGVTHSYTCWVDVDWQGLEVTGIEANDVVTSESYAESVGVYVYANSSDLDTVLDNIKPIIDRDDATYEIVKGDDNMVYLDISYGVITRRYEVYTYLSENSEDD